MGSPTVELPKGGILKGFSPKKEGRERGGRENVPKRFSRNLSVAKMGSRKGGVAKGGFAKRSSQKGACDKRGLEKGERALANGLRYNVSRQRGVAMTGFAKTSSTKGGSRQGRSKTGLERVQRRAKVR